METLDPSKFHKLDVKYRKWYVGAVLLFLLLIGPVLFYVYYETALERPAQGHKEATFVITEGESISSIAQRLYVGELINSAFLFKVHLISQGFHTKIQAGVYRIPAGTSAVSLSQLFQHGTNDVSVTFLEGWRVEEYARFASKTFRRVDYQEFLKQAKEREGFLFPDTYFFSTDVTEEEIIERLSKTFNEKTANALKSSKLERLGMTEEEVVIFASIIEREVFDDEDRPIVAGILIKRWRAETLIGADATTQYAVAHLQVCDSEATAGCPTAQQALSLDWWPKSLSTKDLGYDSPYNTRKNVGLPPKPIANPGLAAIEAVIDFRETPSNYYLTDESGITHYANTLEEHNRNIAQFL